MFNLFKSNKQDKNDKKLKLDFYPYSDMTPVIHPMKKEYLLIRELIQIAERYSNKGFKDIELTLLRKASKNINDYCDGQEEVKSVDICQCSNDDWKDFKMKQQVICGSCDKPVSA